MADRQRTTGGILAWQVVIALSIPAVWEATWRITSSTWISAPSLVAVRLATWASDGLAEHIATTAEEIATGLVIGCASGVLCGLVLGRMPILAGILRPIIVALYSVPLISLAPLFMRGQLEALAPSVLSEVANVLGSRQRGW